MRLREQSWQHTHMVYNYVDCKHGNPIAKLSKSDKKQNERQKKYKKIKLNLSSK